MYRRYWVLFIALVTLGAWTYRSLWSQTDQGRPASDGVAAGEQRDAQDSPSPTRLLRDATSYLGNLPALSCRLTMNYRIKATNMNYDMSTKMAIRLQRPKRLAVILEEGMMGATIVCDGEQVLQYVPMLKRYTVEDAPEQLSELETAGGSMMGGFGGLLGPTTFAGGDALYDQLMAGVTESEYVDQQDVDGVLCHHCRFLQEDMNWELWVEAGERPLIRKIAPDLTKQLAHAGEQFAQMFKDAKMDFSVITSDWNTDPEFTDADFEFTPPAGAEKVESLLGGLAGGDEGPHPLVGKDAPIFTTVDLEQNKVNLQDHLGKDIVILDFWATWCGPCVRAMPHIAKVADAFADKGVILYAVNVREQPDVVTEFLDSKDLSIPVALDRDGEVSALYKAEAIPQTVVIGKDGRVQVVHVGFSSALEDQLTEELESLLAGEDLATATLEAAAPRQAKREENQHAPETEGVALAWSADGRWDSVTVDRTSRHIYTVDGRGNAAMLDSHGAIQREFQLEHSGSILRSANLVDGEATEIISFHPWGPDVRAHRADGSQLWAYSIGQGVDDVWAADVNGDGLDEVIIGYNGSTGLHVLDHQGTPLWTYTGIGNVWHVSAGDFDGDGEMNVLSTSAAGKLHVFDADGNSTADYDVSIYANMVRAVQLNGPDEACLAILGGSTDNGDVLIAVENGGKELWSVGLPGSNHIDSAAIAGDMPWAAVGMRGGLVYVVDLDQGRVIGQITDQGQRPQVCWLASEDTTPLLLVATGDALNSLAITREP